MESLPDLTLFEIFKHLEPKDIGHVARCCQRFYNLANSNHIWQNFCRDQRWIKFGTSCDLTQLTSIMTADSNVSGTSPIFPSDLDLSHTAPALVGLPPVCKWHRVFLMALHLDTNWRRGKYLVSRYLRCHETGKITGLDCFQDLLASGDTVGVLCIWQLSKLQVARQTKADSGITCLRLPDNERLFVGLEVGGVALYDPATLICLTRFHGRGDEILHFQLLERLLITVGGDNVMQVWDLATGRLSDIQRGHSDEITCLTVQTESCLIGTGSWDGDAIVWRADLRRFRVVEVTRLQGHVEAVSCLRLVDPRAVTASHDGTLKVWSLTEGECLAVMEGHKEIYCLDILDDLIVSGGSDSTVRVWDWSGKLHHVMEGHFGVVRFIRLTEHRLISAGDVRKILVWDPWTGQKLSELHRNPAQIGHFWVSETNLIVASPSQPGTITMISYW